MWFDMYLRDGANRPIGRDLTGTGPFSVSYGSISSKVFTGLAANTKYCFSLRTRTLGGTQGCISALASNIACTTTLPAGAPPVPPVPPPMAQRITISATGRPNNTIVITGGGFRPNAPVTVRVADDALKQVFLTANDGQRITSEGNGTINLTFHGLCTNPGNLYFSANDGRQVPPRVDVTGVLWSNTVKIICT